MDFKSRSDVKFGAALRKGVALAERIRAQGFWNMKCFSPLELTDPEKAAHIIEKAGLPKPRLIEKALLTAKEARALLEQIPDLESLLYGGGVKWAAGWENLVVNEGLDHLLDVTLSAATQITTWYVGLIDGTTPTIAAGDTLASHAGWTENQNYTEGVRQTWTDGGVSSQSVDNSGSVASFSIDTNSQTISGAFLASDNTKGGTTGTLYAAGEFSTDKSADSGDTLEVTATFTQADDGA